MDGDDREMTTVRVPTNPASVKQGITTSEEDDVVVEGSQQHEKRCNITVGVQQPKTMCRSEAPGIEVEDEEEEGYEDMPLRARENSASEGNGRIERWRQGPTFPSRKNLSSVSVASRTSALRGRKYFAIGALLLFVALAGVLSLLVGSHHRQQGNPEESE